jgi:hypothetical protein
MINGICEGNGKRAAGGFADRAVYTRIGWRIFGVASCGRAMEVQAGFMGGLAFWFLERVRQAEEMVE